MKNSLRTLAGALAASAFPKTAAAIARGEIIPSSRVQRLIAKNLTREAAQSGTDEQLHTLLSGYWEGSAGDYFYDAYPERFVDWFLGDHYIIVENMNSLLSRDGDTFDRLVEIGCGDGRVLDHLSRNLAGRLSCIGLDLNPRIIERNQRQPDLRDSLRFEQGHAREWLRDNPACGTLLFSYGGVMEYLPESELSGLFADLAATRPAAVALVEPLYGDYDPGQETESSPGGEEFSFNHNHRNLLEKNGFTVQFAEERVVEDFRWILLLATLT